MGGPWLPQALHGAQGPHVPIGSLTPLHQPHGESQSAPGNLCSAWSTQCHVFPVETYTAPRAQPDSTYWLRRRRTATQKRDGDKI